MRKLPKKYLARKYLLGAAVLTVLGAGVAEAATAKLHTLKVDAPDGAVVEVQYSGNVAPRVQVVPAGQVVVPAVMPVMTDPFAQMERVSAIMDAHMQAMMQRAALLQQQAAQMQQEAVAHGQVADQTMPGFTVAADMPKGMHMTYYSATTDANGCTRTVSYSSDGSDAAPKLTQAVSDGCGAVQPSTRAIPAKVEKVEKPAVESAAPDQKV